MRYVFVFVLCSYCASIQRLTWCDVLWWMALGGVRAADTAQDFSRVNTDTVPAVGGDIEVSLSPTVSGTSPPVVVGYVNGRLVDAHVQASGAVAVISVGEGTGTSLPVQLFVEGSTPVSLSTTVVTHTPPTVDHVVRCTCSSCVRRRGGALITCARLWVRMCVIVHVAVPVCGCALRSGTCFVVRRRRCDHDCWVELWASHHSMVG